MSRPAWGQEVATTQEVHFVGANRRVALPKGKPYRIWTLYEKPASLPMVPVHNTNAFLEDFVHDWNYRGTDLYYYSRVAQDNVWILVEYPVESKKA